MKPVARFYQQARQDLLDQALYLTENASLSVAERLLEAAESTADKLAEMPQLGRVWEGLRPETEALRVWSVDGFPKILLFYRQTDEGIAVVRVLHSARDLPPLLDGLP